MDFLTQIVLLFSCFCQIFCDYNSECQTRGKEKLDGFVVTWSQPDQINSYSFNHLPRTIKDAEAQKWTLLDDGCKNSSLMYNGKRYILGDDVSVLIVYDGQGNVAGIHPTLPRGLADSKGTIDFMNSAQVFYQIIKGKERYVMPIYFVDPSSICSGRNDEELEEQGTMTQLYIRNGKDKYLAAPPLIEDKKAMSEANLIRALCVPTMGEHFFYNMTKCDDMIPYFIVYDCGRLHALQVFLVGNVAHEPRFEHVPKEQMKGFINQLPDCILKMYNENTSGFTTFHVYFTKDPQSVTCPE